MNIELKQRVSGRCKICMYAGKLEILSEKNDGNIVVPPRYLKQVIDIIKLIRQNKCEGLLEYSSTDYLGRKYYKLAPLYKINYPNKRLRFYSNNILEEDFDDIINLLQNVEVNMKVNLNQKDLCNYNLFQLKTILTSMKRRKKIYGVKDNYYINLEV